MSDKLPALHLYVQDYLADTRPLSNELKGFYMDVLCYMHKSSRRGFLLQPNGNPYSFEQLGKMTGCSSDEASRLIQDLLSSEVISATPKGIPYSRRMVRDEKARIEYQKAGRKGGNPDLGIRYNLPGKIYLMSRSNGHVKIGCSVNPNKRMYKIREALRDSSVEVLLSWPVADMGKEEEKLHKEYAQYQVSGEWFHFPKEILEILLKGNSKGTIKGSLEDENKDLKSSSSGGDARGGSGLHAKNVLASVDPGNYMPAPPDPPNIGATLATVQKAVAAESPKVEFWDPICRIFKLHPATANDDDRLWQQCQDFRAKGATVPELERRAAEYRARHPRATFSPNAVLNNWDFLAEPLPPEAPKFQGPTLKKAKAFT